MDWNHVFLILGLISHLFRIIQNIPTLVGIMRGGGGVLVHNLCAINCN